jgi:S1-C subfamily serine protease
MKRLYSHVLAFVTGFAACAWIIHRLPPYQGSSAAVATFTGYSPGGRAARLPSPREHGMASDAIARAEPSVVNIDTVGRAAPGRGGASDRFLWRFFGRPGPAPEGPRARGIASGVLIDPNGTIVTNNHVVADAERILVTLADGRKFEGTVVGTDVDSDLAIVRIPGKNLPHAAIGDVRSLRKGDWVVALGNPLGLGSTATVGVVSASRRGPVEVEGRTLQSVIQTDAAINQGNSGGALVNIAGELVGINTAILSTSFAGGSIGIGFAIPINDAWPIIRQLLRSGRVIRPWIGIQYEPAGGENAWQSTETPRGVHVTRVLRGSPAAAAGLATGDVIRRLGTMPVESTSDVFRFVARHSPGETVAVQVRRGNATRTLRLRLAQKPDQVTDLLTQE